MKVCFIVDNLNPQAGLGRMVRSISSGLQARGHDLGFIISTGETDLPFLNISFTVSKLNPAKFILDLVRIRKFVKNYDVIVCIDAQPAGILAHLATIGRSDKIVLHAIATYSLFTRSKHLKNKLIGLVFKTAERVFIINDFVKKKIEDSKPGFKFGNNTTIVPVGVDTSSFIKSERPYRKYGDTYIVSVGAIKPRKGQLDSIKAFCKIKDIYPDLQYVIVGSTMGETPYYKQISEFISAHNLNGRVHFLENVSDDELIDIYSGAVFFILTPTSTSEYIEGFCMAYIEAALCGLPAIGTWDTGAEVAIKDGETGLLARQSDIDSIAEKMQIMLDDQTLRDRMARKAFTLATTYDWEHVVDLYESELLTITKN